MGRVKKQHQVADEAGKTFPPRKRSIPYGFDFDLDEVWAPNNPHLKHLKNVSGSSTDKARGTKSQSSKFSSCQSLRKRGESAKHESAEFDTETEIFKERDIETQTKSVLSDIAKLSNNLESVALRDAYGRELRRRDSVDSSYVPEDSSSSLGNSYNSSPLSTMSKIQLSNVSSASSSSRKSSNDHLPENSRHRSFSSTSASRAVGRRPRQMSAGSVVSRTSRLSRSPGLPRKVSSSANMLTTGLAAERRQKRSGSRGHSPSKY